MKESERRIHKEGSMFRIQKDAECGKQVMEVIEDWRNPFEESKELVSLSSGFVAINTMKEVLLTAEQKAKSALSSLEHWTNKKTNATRFFDTLPKLKLGTFNEAAKRESVIIKGKNVVLQTDRNLCARLLVIGHSRKTIELCAGNRRKHINVLDTKLTFLRRIVLTCLTEAEFRHLLHVAWL